MTERKQGRRSAETAEQTKCQIMAVAADLFCEFGYERVSIRNISEKAGVSHSLIRYHFGSKEKIWHSISDALDSVMQESIINLLKMAPEHAEANVKLYHFTVRLLAQMLENPKPMQLIADGIRQEGTLFDYFITKHKRHSDLLSDLYQQFNDKYGENVTLWEMKWTTMMYAHSAISLQPFLFQAFSQCNNDLDLCLLEHWRLFNRQMAYRFKVEPSDMINPSHLNELTIPMMWNWK